MKTFHVYGILNIKTHDAYVGCTHHLTQRYWRHTDALAKGTHHSRLLQEAWKKHGPEAFQFSVILMLEDVSPKTARQAELAWIAKIGTYNEMGSDLETGKVVWSERLRANMAKHTRRRWTDPEQREALASGLLKGNGFVKGMRSVKSPEESAAHSAHMKKVWADPERSAKLEARRKARWLDPKARANQAEKMRAYHAARRAAQD
jgi:hypothetical protein